MVYSTAIQRCSPAIFPSILFCSLCFPSSTNILPRIVLQIHSHALPPPSIPSLTPCRLPQGWEEFFNGLVQLAQQTQTEEARTRPPSSAPPHLTLFPLRVAAVPKPLSAASVHPLVNSEPNFGLIVLPGYFTERADELTLKVPLPPSPPNFAHRLSVLTRCQFRSMPSRPTTSSPR